MEKYPNRKIIRLPDYDYSQNGCYFVTVCTYERQPLFGSIRDGVLIPALGLPHAMIEKWLGELGNKYPSAKIDYYVVMPDHIHMLLSISHSDGGASLKEMMDWFKTMTTNEFIRQVKAGVFLPFHKKIWQRGYFDHIIRNEQDYIDTAQYIQNNPIAWNYKHKEG